MPLQLMKLQVSVTTTTNVTPASDKYFYVTVAETEANESLTIDAASFFDDTGDAVTALPVLAAGNSYFQVYVNGVLQMQDILTYTPGATGVGLLKIDVPDGEATIPTNSPVVLEIAAFAPTSTSTVVT